MVFAAWLCKRPSMLALIVVIATVTRGFREIAGRDGFADLN